MRRILLTLLLVSGLFAYFDNTEERVRNLETQMSEIRVTTSMDTVGVEMMTARPEVDGYKWFVTFDLLRWHPFVGGTEFSYKTNSASFPIPEDFPISGRLKDVDLGWGWGLRAGLGYNWEHDQWDTDAIYTYYSSQGSSGQKGSPTTSVIPLRGAMNVGFNPVTFVKRADSEFDLDLQAINVSLGRNYFVSSQLSFRPSFGLKATWLDLMQTTRYTGGNQLGINTIHMKDDCDFGGFGPRGGLEMRWHVGAGFSIATNAFATLSYGYFDVEHKERFSAVRQNRLKVETSFHRAVPQAELQMGLNWDAYFDDNMRHFGVALYYETQYYWRHNQSIVIDDVTNLRYELISEDVQFTGLTLSLRLDF